MTNGVRALVLIIASSGSAGLGSWSCGGSDGPPPVEPFLADANATLLKLGIEAGQASWVYSTYITQDTEALNARANQAAIEAGKRFAKEAARYDNFQVTPEQRRQLNLLKLSLELVTPSETKEAEEVTKLAAAFVGELDEARVVLPHRDRNRVPAFPGFTNLFLIARLRQDVRDLLDVHARGRLRRIPAPLPLAVRRPHRGCELRHFLGFSGVARCHELE
jgi:hypothetical protein